MRACRSTYWPVTSVALVDTPDGLAERLGLLEHRREVVHRHLQGHAAVGGARPHPIWVCELATKPPLAPASAVSAVIVAVHGPAADGEPERARLLDPAGLPHGVARAAPRSRARPPVVPDLTCDCVSGDPLCALLAEAWARRP